jgi:precorrin isomerase
MPYTYEMDGAAIYRQSFATIRAEADLARFTPAQEPVVVRMIHAAGLVGLEAHVAFTQGMAEAARALWRQVRRSCAMRAWSPKGSPAPACLLTIR